MLHNMVLPIATVEFALLDKSNSQGFANSGVLWLP